MEDLAVFTALNHSGSFGKNFIRFLKKIKMSFTGLGWSVLGKTVPIRSFRLCNLLKDIDFRWIHFPSKILFLASYETFFVFSLVNLTNCYKIFKRNGVWFLSCWFLLFSRWLEMDLSSPGHRFQKAVTSASHQNKRVHRASLWQWLIFLSWNDCCSQTFFLQLCNRMLPIS